MNVIYDKSTQNEITLKTNQQIKRLIRIYIILLVLSIVFAYLLLKQIASPLRSIAKHLSSSQASNNLEPLSWPVADEIGQIVESYNNLMTEHNQL